MSRTLSLTFLEAIHAQETDEVPVVLLTITHSDLDEPIRLCSNPTVRLGADPLLYATVSRDEIYYFLPFSLVLPDDKEDAPPTARIVIDNVDRQLIRILRSTATPAQVLIEIVLVSAPDDVEISFPAMDLVSADYDAQSVTITLAIDSLSTEPYPSGTFDPVSFSGLF